MSFDHDPFVVTLTHLLTPGEAVWLPFENADTHEFADIYQPSSCYGVLCHTSRGRVFRCVIMCSAGATSPHDHSMVIIGTHCYLTISNRICSLTLPELRLEWSIDDARVSPLIPEVYDHPPDQSDCQQHCDDLARFDPKLPGGQEPGDHQDRQDPKSTDESEG